MEYEAVYLYNKSNEFIGATIKKVDAPKLQTINIWSDSPEDTQDFKNTLNGLNDEQALRSFWPGADDAEVAELVENPGWEPLKLYEAEVPDWDNSTIVDDEFGGIDQEQSTIVFTTAMVPDATDAQNRYYKAQETVARRRLDAAR